MLNAINTNVTSAQSMSSPLKSAYESEAMKTIRSGVNALVDSLPGLIKALDEVAKLHPFIGSMFPCTMTPRLSLFNLRLKSLSVPSGWSSSLT